MAQVGRQGSEPVYGVRVRCGNCGTVARIPYGTRFDSDANKVSVLCVVCGHEVRPPIMRDVDYSQLCRWSLLPDIAIASIKVAAIREPLLKALLGLERLVSLATLPPFLIEWASTRQLSNCIACNCVFGSFLPPNPPEVFRLNDVKERLRIIRVKAMELYIAEFGRWCWPNSIPELNV